MKSLLRELQLLEFVGTADLDKWAFADQRKDLKVKGVKEHNNKIEDELLEELVNYVVDNTPLTPSACKKIQAYRRAGLYKDIFADIPPGTDKIYRGVGLDEKVMATLVGEQNIADSISGKLRGNYVWRPRPGIPASAWSVDPQEANRFCNFAIAEYKLIMVAPTSRIDTDCCFSLVGGLYRVNRVNVNVSEQEIVTFGPISVNFIKWQKNV